MNTTDACTVVMNMSPRPFQVMGRDWSRTGVRKVATGAVRYPTSVRDRPLRRAKVWQS